MKVSSNKKLQKGSYTKEKHDRGTTDGVYIFPPTEMFSDKFNLGLKVGGNKHFLGNHAISRLLTHKIIFKERNIQNIASTPCTPYRLMLFMF